ncbi:MAG: hypothetical protein K2O10_04945 [Muribaculaceae bacterium]|nr:hypothetical protein [Muribaculaceae bacterium]
MFNLKYQDQRDRAYGLSGMAVAMVVWDNEQYLAGLNLDAEADFGLELSPDFFTIANSALSAKAVWNDRVAKFQLALGLMVANVLSRALVRANEEITPQARQMLVKSLHDEGRSACDLTETEVDALFTKAYGYFHSIFAHHAVTPLVDSVAEALENSRRLDRDQIIELLSPLFRQ